MEINIYAFFDSASNSYGRIFDSVTDAKALEQLEDAVKAMPKAYPHMEKKELCRIASVDILTGIVTPLKAPVRIDLTPIFDTVKPIDNIERSMIQEKEN